MAQSTPDLPDVVLMTDGGMARGTIVESVPGAQVTIRLASGESRTIAWAAVRYAGPESERPAPPNPRGEAEAAPVDPASEFSDPTIEEVRVRVTSDQRGLALHRVTGQFVSHGVAPTTYRFVRTAWGGRTLEADYESSTRYRGYESEVLCEAPCELSLLPGRYELGVSAGGSMLPAGLVDIDRAGTLDIAYSDQSTWRVLGWIVWPLGIVGGGLFIPAVLVWAGDLSSVENVRLGIGGGMGIMAGALLAGISMILAGDGAVVRFE